MILEGGAVKFEPAEGVAATVDGEAAAAMKRMSFYIFRFCRTGLKIGTYGFAVRVIGGDSYLLVRNSENPSIARFTGTSWFPIHRAYRVKARFTAYAQPEQVPVPLTHVDSKETMTSLGEVTFQWAGNIVRLKSFTGEGRLFVMFQDRTNGRETYGGGRFLYAPMPKDGTTVLDFNKAFNPYCSVNSYVMCPVPPPENRLAV